jgi:hypothetical protein
MVGEINITDTPYDMLGMSETEIETPTEKLVDFQETVESGDTMGAMNMLPRGNQLVEAEQLPPVPVNPPVSDTPPNIEPKKEITANRIFKDPVYISSVIKSITPKEVQEDVIKGEARQEEAKITKLAGMLREKIGGGLPRNAMNFDPRMATAKDQGKQVATLAVSPKEYVVDAHTMSALGNGNPDAGARYMDRMVKNIREKAYGTDQQPNEINGLASLRPMMERV